MQSEVQVSYYLLLVWDSYHTKQLFILFSEVALQLALLKESVGTSIKDGQVSCPYEGRLAKLIYIVLKPFCVTLFKVDQYSFRCRESLVYHLVFPESRHQSSTRLFLGNEQFDRTLNQSILKCFAHGRCEVFLYSRSARFSPARKFGFSLRLCLKVCGNFSAKFLEKTIVRTHFLV